MNEREASESASDRVAPVLDKSAALARMGGDEELYDEIFDLFVEDAPKQLALLATAISNGDRPVAQRQAHSLKSAAGNIGGTRMAQLCERFERTALTEPTESLEARLAEIVGALQQILDCDRK